MNSLKKSFITTYDPIMAKKGFKRKGKIYHRLVNKEIVQMLSYFKYSHSFTIQFLIAPLCSGVTFSSFMDECRLGLILGNENYAEWDLHDEYTVSLEKSVGLCERLFQYFEEIHDCKSYIDNMHSIYKRAYGNKWESILSKNIMLYGPYLKTGAYDFVRQMQFDIITQNINAIQNNLKYNIRPTEKKIRELKKRQSEFNRMSEAMDNNDSAYIGAYVTNNEQISIKSYRKFCRKPFVAI